MRHYFRPPFHGIAVAVIVATAIALPTTVGYLTGVMQARIEYQRALDARDKAERGRVDARGWQIVKVAR